MIRRPIKPPRWPPGTLKAHPLTPETLQVYPLTPGTLHAYPLIPCDPWAYPLTPWAHPLTFWDPECLPLDYHADHEQCVHNLLWGLWGCADISRWFGRVAARPSCQRRRPPWGWMKCQPSPGAPTRRHHHRRHRCHHHFHTSQSIENTTKICLYLVVTIASMGSGRRNFWPSSDLYHPYLQNSGSSSKIMTKVQPLSIRLHQTSKSWPKFSFEHQLLSAII